MREPIMEKNDAGLSARGLVKTYSAGGRKIAVLQGLDLEVCAGSTVVIVGPSGAGKTTLLNILGGLDCADAGELTVLGCRLTRRNVAALTRLRRDRIGFIFQNFNLIESWTALENVEAALLHQPLAARARREQALAVLSELGLEAWAGHRPAELSAGQAQRVAVARVLVRRPELILADEPTGSVDPETGAVLARILYAQVGAGRGTLVVATHGAFPRAGTQLVLRLEHGILQPAV